MPLRIGSSVPPVSPKLWNTGSAFSTTSDGVEVDPRGELEAIGEQVAVGQHDALGQRLPIRW